MHALKVGPALVLRPVQLTYMKEDFTIVVHPANDNVRIGHSSIWRDAKTDPAICGHVDTERDRLFDGAEVPVQSVERIAIPICPQYSREGISVEVALAATQRE